MKMKNKTSQFSPHTCAYAYVTILFLLIVGLALPVCAEEERKDGYYSMVDREGKVICRTAHRLEKGDEYLTADNFLYRVEQVEGDQARVRFVRKVQLTASPSILSQFGRKIRALVSWDSDNGTELETPVQAKERPIAIYHTHTDESYVPTEGRASVESEGGIIEVGEAFAQALKERGIAVIHDRTSHVPHDSMAYDRSRRTAVELLKKNPIALLDIHRDAVPKEEYTDEVNNTTVSKIQFVVGRQNPNQEANDSFARQIKQVVDRKYPGLVKGIFYGKGKYNQDLAPRLILIEVGTHTNTRQEAERGAAIFASAAQEVLARPVRTEKNVRQGSGRSFLWIIGVAVAGIAIFLVLNGGWNKIRSDVGRMTGGNVETNSEPGGEDDSPREE